MSFTISGKRLEAVPGRQQSFECCGVIIYFNHADRSVLLILITQTDQSFSGANHCSLQAKTGIALFTVRKQI